MNLYLTFASFSLSSKHALVFIVVSLKEKNPTEVSFYFARLAFLLRDREIDKKKFLTKTVLESRIVFALLTKETHEFALFSNNSADYNQHFFVSSLTFQTIN